MRVPNEEDTMYTAPTDDMQFLIDDVLDVGTVLGELRITLIWVWAMT